MSTTVLYSNSFDSTFGANVSVEGDAQIRDGAAYFDGNGDGLLINDPALASIGTNDFSISLRFKTDGAQDPYSVLISRFGSSYLEIANGLSARNGL